MVHNFFSYLAYLLLALKRYIINDAEYVASSTELLSTISITLLAREKSDRKIVTSLDERKKG